ncbi:MAG: PAS domain S-box protein [Melioribacteraceae bacterium]|nr:PAS domain S-box protein [Melioribacteraceae bacterium]
MIVLDLVYNLSVLIALSILSGFIDTRFNRNELTGKLLQGLLFGVTAIIGMMYPFVLREGIIFDGRSIVISLSTLFFGPVTGIITSAMAVIYRMVIGGGGVLTGTLVILSSFVIGFLFHLYKQRLKERYISNGALYLSGLVVHVVMLMLMFTLPSGSIAETYETVSFTILGIYPLASLIIGKILLDQEKNFNFLIRLKESEVKYRDLFDAHHDGITIFEINEDETLSKLVEVNESATELIGYTKEELYKKYVDEIERKIPEKELNDRIATLKKEGYVNFETRLIHKSGSLVPVEVTALVIKYKNKKAVMNIVRDISRREKALDELEKSEKKFREIFNSSLELMFIHDHAGKILDVNNAVLEKYGYQTTEEYIMNSIADISANIGDYTQEVAERLIKRSITQGPQRFEWLGKSKDGTNFWLEILLKKIEIDGKERVLAVGRDITERKEARVKLEHSHDLLQYIIEHDRAAVAVHDTELRYIYVSQSYLKQYNVTDPNIIGKHHYDVFPDLPEKWREVHRKALKGIVSSAEDDPYFKEDGTITWTRWECRPWYNADKTIGGIIVYTEVIDQRKKAELALQESEERFRRLAENAQDLIYRYEFSPERGFSYVSPAATSITGYSPEDHYNDPDLGFKIVHPDDRQLLENTASEINDFSKPLAIRWIKKDGNIIWIEQINIPVYDDAGNLIALEGIARDITERKQSEKALIENERLSAIGQTAAAVAHDFNNSLQAIYSNLELCLMDKSIPGSVRERISTVESIANDAATRVRILQKFGSDSNRTNQFQLLNLNNIITEVIVQSKSLWKDEAQKSGIYIKVETHLEEIPNVMGNASELRTTFYNIIKNSVEAMPDGGTITIKSGFKADAIIINITDTGIGMDDKTKSRVFQPFFTTKGYQAGRGIGMSGVFSIIKDHKGSIEIKRTKPNEGTTIEIILPASYNQDQSIEKEDTELTEEQNLSILWVDDDQLIRNVASDMLDAIGHCGDVVDCGEKALDLMKKNKYDIVVTDIGMPGMNGWQLADEIRKIDERIKLAVLSGWGSQIDDEKLKKHKVDGVLPKPFQIKQLTELICTIRKKDIITNQ